MELKTKRKREWYERPGKTAGDKSFLEGNYEEAVKNYTYAINECRGIPHHIYFCSRAHALLRLGKYDQCVEDCDTAIRLYP